MGNEATTPVIAGLAIGIGVIVLFATLVPLPFDIALYAPESISDKLGDIVQSSGDR